MAEVLLEFSFEKTSSDPKERGCLIIGSVLNFSMVTYDNFAEKLQPSVDSKTFNLVLRSLSESDSCNIWLNQVVACSLPSNASRHNSPCHPHVLKSLVKSYLPAGNAVIVVVCEKKDVFASGCAIARCFPLFSLKTNSSAKQSKKITVEFVTTDGQQVTDDDIKCLTSTAESIRLAAKIVDIPCNIMHTDNFLEEIRKVGKELGIEPTIIQGEELRERGFGGIYGVGKAAIHQPALAILSHTPKDATRTFAWVGKGIVYDTGGLSIKGKTAMPGMKRDCGGAAAILGAFRAAVKQGFRENLHGVFCLAENAVGPNSTRPDDIHTFYSGKTVEINNTDAEGRLVLADGVYYARKDLKADVVLDMATLTGAQGIATGRYHGGLLTNKESWEIAAVQAGRKSGDLLHPLPYCPELHFCEFSSVVADMKNSVKNRDNAQSSCAGLFIGAHLGFDYPGAWIHVDMASPVESGERATGYGVALLLTLFGQSSSNSLLKIVASSLPAKDAD
ncbi:probable aminopeptidase NPEPL1 [Actinia tenebrosa]|uniref:Probable aminopeptidase NPEPL1 n=1 Tax=Actinia tenebrosa TaxID=6105 RepID=A0A6P8IY42_ACTTE|nr:probable aminopeptidase NPEPL1 [Actinia tenebrosa]